MSTIKKAILRPIRRNQRSKALDQALADGLPSQLEPALRWLATEQRSGRAESVAAKVEQVRNLLAARPGGVTVFYSPKPTTAGDDTGIEARPEAGQAMEFSHERIARETSTKAAWGSFLNLVAAGFDVRRIVELGSCAGIGTSYMALAPQKPQVLSVEGSEGLAAIARDSVGFVGAGDRVEVVNALFDDALDERLPGLTDEGVDLAWIDGHHEQTATIHYFRRLIPALKPGAVVLFDDTSWSQDMRDCWDRLAAWDGFSHTIDLGKLGLGVWAGEGTTPRTWDLRAISGHRGGVSVPKGW